MAHVGDVYGVYYVRISSLASYIDPSPFLVCNTVVCKPQLKVRVREVEWV